MPSHDSELETELLIGPTENGMVRILVTVGNQEIPMDFFPDEAEEIANELRAAAGQAGGGKKKK